MQARNISYDLMRVVACLMIICMHAPLPSPNAMPLLLNATGYFMAPGLCLFFVLSGALLLPTTLSARAFLRKRLAKVLWPTLSFTAIYLAIKYFSGEQVDWLTTIASIPFSPQGHGVLWFMYTLISLYLLTPIISPWLAKTSRRELEFYLLLWAITLCYPLLQLLLHIDTTVTGPLYYFTGYAGYFLLGHYLHKYPDALSLKHLALPVAIAVIAPIVCKLGHIEVDFYSIFWYMSIFVAILTAALFKAINRCKFATIRGGKLQRFIILSSNLSFGIYLCHIAIMRHIIWQLLWVQSIPNYLLQYLTIVTLTLLSTYITTYLLSRLPLAPYLIGYRHKASPNTSASADPA